MGESSTDRLIGELIGRVTGMADDIAELKQDNRDSSAKRAEIYREVKAVKAEVGDVKFDVNMLKKDFAEAKPDIERCRMFRHWGIVSAAFIAFGISIFAFWDHIKRLLP